VITGGNSRARVRLDPRSRAFRDIREQNFDERVVAVEHTPRSNFELTIRWIAASFQLAERVGSVRPTPMIDPVIYPYGDESSE